MHFKLKKNEYNIKEKMSNINIINNIILITNFIILIFINNVYSFINNGNYKGFYVYNLDKLCYQSDNAMITSFDIYNNIICSKNQKTDQYDPNIINPNSTEWFDQYFMMTRWQTKGNICGPLAAQPSTKLSFKTNGKQFGAFAEGGNWLLGNWATVGSSNAPSYKYAIVGKANGNGDITQQKEIILGTRSYGIAIPLISRIISFQEGDSFLFIATDPEYMTVSDDVVWQGGQDNEYTYCSNNKYLKVSYTPKELYTNLFNINKSLDDNVYYQKCAETVKSHLSLSCVDDSMAVYGNQQTSTGNYMINCQKYNQEVSDESKIGSILKTSISLAFSIAGL